MKTTLSATGEIGLGAAPARRLRPLALWPISAAAVALMWLLLILRAATDRAAFDPALVIHAAGADTSSVAAILNPNLVTALLWSGATVWVLVVVLHAAGAPRVAVAALSAVFVVSPVAWDAFLPGSPFATGALTGLALLAVTWASLDGRLSPVWTAPVAFLATLLNTTNLIGLLAVLAGSALAVLPLFRRAGSSPVRPLLASASLAVGGALGSVLAVVLAPPRTAEVLALARPLDLPGLMVQLTMTMQGGIISQTDAGTGTTHYPFSAVMTVPLVWIGMIGAVACVVVTLGDRRRSPFAIGLVVAALIAAPVVAQLLSHLSGGFYGMSGLGVVSILPLLLVAASTVARERIVSAVVLVYALVLGVSLLAWSAVVA